MANYKSKNAIDDPLKKKGMSLSGNVYPVHPKNGLYQKLDYQPTKTNLKTKEYKVKKPKDKFYQYVNVFSLTGKKEKRKSEDKKSSEDTPADKQAQGKGTATQDTAKKDERQFGNNGRSGARVTAVAAAGKAADEREVGAKGRSGSRAAEDEREVGGKGPTDEREAGGKGRSGARLAAVAAGGKSAADVKDESDSDYDWENPPNEDDVEDIPSVVEKPPSPKKRKTPQKHKRNRYGLSTLTGFYYNKDRVHLTSGLYDYKEYKGTTEYKYKPYNEPYKSHNDFIHYIVPRQYKLNSMNTYFGYRNMRHETNRFPTPVIPVPKDPTPPPPKRRKSVGDLPHNFFNDHFNKTTNLYQSKNLPEFHPYTDVKEYKDVKQHNGFIQYIGEHKYKMTNFNTYWGYRDMIHEKEKPKPEPKKEKTPEPGPEDEVEVISEPEPTPVKDPTPEPSPVRRSPSPKPVILAAAVVRSPTPKVQSPTPKPPKEPTPKPATPQRKSTTPPRRERSRSPEIIRVAAVAAIAHERRRTQTPKPIPKEPTPTPIEPTPLPESVHPNTPTPIPPTPPQPSLSPPPPAAAFVLPALNRRIRSPSPVPVQKHLPTPTPPPEPRTPTPLPTPPVEREPSLPSPSPSPIVLPSRRRKIMNWSKPNRQPSPKPEPVVVKPAPDAVFSPSPSPSPPATPLPVRHEPVKPRVVPVKPVVMKNSFKSSRDRGELEHMNRKGKKPQIEIPDAPVREDTPEVHQPETIDQGPDMWYVRKREADAAVNRIVQNQRKHLF